MASKKAQVPVTAKNIRKCTVHPNRDITMSCDTCGDQLVCTKCVVTGHNTHAFSELEDLVDKKRVPLRAFVESSGKHLNKLKSLLTSLQNLKQTVSDNSETLEDSVEKRLKQLQQQLNEFANIIKDEHRTKVGQNVTTIETRIEFVTSLQHEINESLTKCQAALETQSVWDIIDFQLNCDSNDKLNSELAQVPLVSNYHLTFHDKKMSGHMFGTLTEMNSNVKDNKEPHLPPLPSRKDAEIEPPLLETAQHFHLSFGSIHAICIVNKNEAWISYVTSHGGRFELFSTIHHVTHSGDVLSTVELDSPVIFLQLSSDKSLLASCKDNKMRDITPGDKISVLFECHGYISGFCEVGKTHDIVVCLKNEGRVVKYSKKGKVLQSLSSCVKEPIKISANKVTGEMVIADRVKQMHRKLVVVDAKMNFLWEVDSWLGTPLDGTISEFIPNQACYDKDGNILAVNVSANGSYVIKIKNKKVHKLKHIGWDNSYSIDIDDEMWIGMKTGDVIIASSDI